MVDYVGLGLLVISGYILIQYGPQIAANIQAGQNPLTGVVPAAQVAPPVDTTGAAAPAPTIPPPAIAAPILEELTGVNRPLCNDPQFPIYHLSDNSCHPDAQNVFPAQTAPPPVLAMPFVGVGGGGNANLSIPPRQPTSLNSPSGTPKLTNQHCVPGTGPGTGQACVPIIGGSNTRSAKKKVPPHAVAKAKTCHGLKCGPGTGVTCGGLGCPQLDANVGYSNTYSLPRMGPEWYSSERQDVYQANVGVVQGQMTQVVNGKSITTIDPFFPAGFYLAEANRKSSLHEPALH